MKIIKMKIWMIDDKKIKIVKNSEKNVKNSLK